MSATRTAAAQAGQEALHLGGALSGLARAYAARAKPVLVDVPGGARGQQVLYAVTAGTATSQAALADYLGVNRTIMTYLIDELESAGLVERQQDPRDRRNRQIVATDQGRQLLSELDRRIRQVEDDVFAGLTDEERETLGNLLHKAAHA